MAKYFILIFIRVCQLYCNLEYDSSVCLHYNRVKASIIIYYLSIWQIFEEVKLTFVQWKSPLWFLLISFSLGMITKNIPTRQFCEMCHGVGHVSGRGLTHCKHKHVLLLGPIVD